MRLYEFAKRYGVPSKDLLEKLKGAGFKIASHMSALSDEARTFLEKDLKSDTTPAPAKKIQKEPPKKEQTVHHPPPQVVQSPIKEKPTEITKEVHDTSSVVLALEPTSTAELARLINQPVNDVIMLLLQWGILSTKNQVLPEEIVARLAQHYGVETEKRTARKEKIIKKETTTDKDLEPRLPVIVVLGHVDHGKTSLLDYIRKTRVTAKEKGGITQHLGAYEAETQHGNIIFIDTPGHEAFSKIRERGAHLADIAILLVAADDSVMPQTIEAIRFAKEANLPVIVAINKIDKVGVGQVEATKRDLAQHDLLAEEWGGQTVSIPISAKEGTGVDQLLEMLTLQAELMELRAASTGKAQGYVLESKLEKGRGPVATILLQQGRIKRGDYFVCGTTSGRVSSIVDSHGRKLNEAGPSNPVQIAGFDDLPDPADLFQSLPKSLLRKAVAQRADYAELPKYIPQDSINLIIKTDTLSSQEALVDAIKKLSRKAKKEVGKEFNIIYAGVGDISERDIILASTTGSHLIAFHVKVSPLDQKVAQQSSVSIETFDIIYKLLERLEEIAQQAKAIKMIRKKIGEAVVRRVFDIKNVGVIAGCYVRDGLFTRDGFVAVVRDGSKVGEGKIKSLQREKKDMKEVHAGYECAFMVEGFNEWRVDDTVECFVETPEV